MQKCKITFYVTHQMDQLIKIQMDLIKRYGNEMILLDATYKTTRYVLPLFFMVVKTNVDYHLSLKMKPTKQSQKR